jgi:hypothetical protein
VGFDSSEPDPLSSLSLLLELTARYARQVTLISGSPNGAFVKAAAGGHM